MPSLTIGEATYRIRTSQRTGQWTAWAVRAESGDRFGLDFASDSQASAIAAVTRWLEWQHDHAQALEGLQEAERAYHRSVAGNLFATAAADESTTRQRRREALERMEQAKGRLDEVRSRRPA